MSGAQANQHQNSPSITDLDRQIEEDARTQAAGTVEDEPIQKESVKGPKQYPTPVEDQPEVEETEEQAEEVEDKVEEKETHKEEDTHQERIRKLAFDKRESQRQLRQAQDEIARLKGQKPALASDEEFEKRVNEAAAARANEQRFLEKCEQVKKAGDSKFSDFGETLSILNKEQLLPNHVIEVILETDTPADVIDYLAKNIDEAEDINKLSPHRMGMALAKIANKVNKPVPPKPQSKAAPPIRPVTGTSKASPNMETMNIRDFMKMEDERTKSRRRYS